MEIAYFSNTSANITKYVDHPDGGIVGEALLFYEGEHLDNQKRKHLVPAERIQLLASNTNADFNQGRDIPLMVEHNRKLIDKDGSLNRLGKMASAVSCRPIEEKDLANPRLTDLVGKLGAFAQVHILDKIDAVKNKVIKPISAGIDPIKNKFIEISAVADPSLAGAALLFSNPYSVASFSQHGMTDYKEAKERIEAWEKPHEEMHKMFDIFVGTLQAIEMKSNDDRMNFNLNELKRNALEQYTEDLIDYLKISFDSEEEEDTESIYNENAYDPNLYQQEESTTNYSASEDLDNVLNFSESQEKRIKRKRRGAS